MGRVTSDSPDGGSDPYPAHFFDRDDPSSDDRFYAVPRMVTHIDEGAVAAVGALYTELGVDSADAAVLDLMSSWTSHLRRRPGALTVLGMNRRELDANAFATERVVADLNVDPSLPFPDASFDAVLCCVSIDYLVRPVEVLAETARVLRPGAPVVITFSNRCFPTKAILGWLSTDDAGHLAIVADYLRRAGGFKQPELSLRTPLAPGYRGDPLYAVVARRLG
ncbi:SAM-dependent methyltransferase [Friedmanniella endophytica]|uniref:SAM-dependent methyltransferase n=1 Tax=Microlunatus kandeliicorticis TaxID=1759536 RepID=A0A7W3IPP3_9ACTN|nr:methyltransferase domain-containing protein [Microlunatus kandeliicorticis]MBA8792967.1 SAM-dependent methyltransferase [Microlunatus kandeliicorticis]